MSCGSFFRRRFPRSFLIKKNYYRREFYSYLLGCYVFFSTREGTLVNCKSLVTLRNFELAGG